MDVLSWFLTDSIERNMVDSMVEYVRYELNRCCVTKFGRKDLYKYFSVVIAMMILQGPSIDSYWSNIELYHNNYISSIMTRDEFLKIHHCFRYCDISNELDPEELKEYE